MPFRTFRSRRRRFSATPRRSWGRRPASTSMPRMQQCQFNFADLISVFAEDNAGDDNPSFFFGSMMPWEHAPLGGYDQSFVLKGIIFDMAIRFDLHVNLSGPQEELPQLAAQPQLMRIVGDLFVDETDPTTGAPVSLLASGTGPLGPIISTPPVGDPALSPSDSQVLPTRHLLRKYGFAQWSRISDTGSSPILTSREVSHVANQAVFRWSPRLRKRVTVGSRQGLYLGAFAVWDFGPATGIEQVDLAITITGTYYYTLKR